MEEMLPLMPPQLSYEVLDFGLHTNPDKLRTALQNAINTAPPNVRTILLGLSLCAKSVVGLKSDRHTLVIPRADDCITIFLGIPADTRGLFWVTEGSKGLTSRVWQSSSQAALQEGNNATATGRCLWLGHLIYRATGTRTAESNPGCHAWYCEDSENEAVCPDERS